jgi:hypothetical protein
MHRRAPTPRTPESTEAFPGTGFRLDGTVVRPSRIKQWMGEGTFVGLSLGMLCAIPSTISFVIVAASVTATYCFPTEARAWLPRAQLSSGSLLWQAAKISGLVLGGAAAGAAIGAAAATVANAGEAIARCCRR